MEIYLPHLLRKTLARERGDRSRASDIGRDEVTAAAAIEAELAALADPGRAAFVAPYLGAVPGGYGEGDVLLGMPVPAQRRVARAHREAPLAEVERLLRSDVHEHRFVALAILCLRFQRADAGERERLARFYIDHRDRVDNWDLVDASAPKLLAERVRGGDRGFLDELVASESVWDRRIAILATFPLIRDGEPDETLRLAERLLGDEHDLIHKAVGWMLREAGKRDEAALRGFLDAHAAAMPRTMLRYSLERLPADVRARYMAAR